MDRFHGIWGAAFLTLLVLTDLEELQIPGEANHNYRLAPAPLLKV